MNKLFKILIGCVLLGFMVSSCDALLDTDSDSIVLPEDNQLNSTKNQRYSIFGILSQLEELGTPYVVLGEVRGDLVDITDNADADMREVYNQAISEDNKYNMKSDYYSVINNCNYIIENMDTSLLEDGEKVMLKESVAARGFRAWAYMQLVQNYGSVIYFTKPLLTVQDAEDVENADTLLSIDDIDEDDAMILDREQLAAVLIEDLLPYVDVDIPEGFSGLGDIDADYLYFPLRFLIGDMYLWTRQYVAAAQMYYDLMNNYATSSIFGSYSLVSLRNKAGVVSSVSSGDVKYEFSDYFSSSDDAVQSWTTSWLYYFDVTSNYGKVAIIGASTEYGEGSPIDTLVFGDYAICPSDVAISNWQNQTYYYNSSLFTTESIDEDYVDVDLRGNSSSYYTNYCQSYGDDSYGYRDDYAPVIRKYMDMNTETTRAINVARSSTLYLRYAEAVNRAGKPNLAFAVLKYGLNATSLSTDSIIPRSEKYVTYTDSTHGAFISWVDFSDEDTYGELSGTAATGNVGIHALGCGNTWLDDTYTIDSCASLSDSIIQVEDMIVEEYALETAFEGGRFQDLMRVALRRDDPSYLAEIVAQKYENAATIKELLSNERNWYLP